MENTCIKIKLKKNLFGVTNITGIYNQEIYEIKTDFISMKNKIYVNNKLWGYVRNSLIKNQWKVEKIIPEKLIKCEWCECIETDPFYNTNFIVIMNKDSSLHYYRKIVPGLLPEPPLREKDISEGVIRFNVRDKLRASKINKNERMLYFTDPLTPLLGMCLYFIAIF